MSGNAPPQPKNNIIYQWAVPGDGAKANRISLFMYDKSPPPTSVEVAVVVVTIPYNNINAMVDSTIIPIWDRTTRAIVVLSTRDGMIVDNVDIGDNVVVVGVGVVDGTLMAANSSVIRVLSLR